MLTSNLIVAEKHISTSAQRWESNGSVSIGLRYNAQSHAMERTSGFEVKGLISLMMLLPSRVKCYLIKRIV